MKKYLLAIAILAGVFAIFAFMPAPEKPVYETVTFQYDYDNDDEIGNTSHWLDKTESEPESCGSSGSLPCVVTFSTEDFEPQGGDRGITSFLSMYSTANAILYSGYLVDSKVSVP